MLIWEFPEIKTILTKHKILKIFIKYLDKYKTSWNTNNCKYSSSC